jgi:hypothetical protein
MRRYAEILWGRVRKLDPSRLRWIATGLIVTFSVVFFGWMLWRTLPTLLAYDWKLQVLPLILGFPIYTFDLLLAVFGWSIIMEQMGHKFTFARHFQIYSTTLVAGRIPGAPWHVVGRVALYKRMGVDVKITSVASGLEMILIIVSGIISSALIGFSLPENMQKYFLWMGLVLVIGLVLMHPAVINKVLQILKHTKAEIPLRYRDMLMLLGLYVLTWGVGGCVLFMVILALYPLVWTQLPGVIGVWGLSGAIASMIFFSPTSLGIREITLTLLLALYIPAGLAVVIAILIRLYVTAAEFTWAIIASRLKA